MAKKKPTRKPRHQKDAVVAGNLVYYSKDKVARAEAAVRKANGIVDLTVDLPADEVLMNYLKLGGHVTRDDVKIPHEDWKTIEEEINANKAKK